MLDPDRFAVHATKLGLDPSPAVLAAYPSVRAALEAAVEAANARLSRVEQIKRFAILPHAWEPGGEELTPTMKLRRRAIGTKYEAQIEALYGHD